MVRRGHQSISRTDRKESLREKLGSNTMSHTSFFSETRWKDLMRRERCGEIFQHHWRLANLSTMRYGKSWTSLRWGGERHTNPADISTFSGDHRVVEWHMESTTLVQAVMWSAEHKLLLFFRCKWTKLQLPMNTTACSASVQHSALL